jgi:hypothetical protein
LEIPGISNISSIKPKGNSSQPQGKRFTFGTADDNSNLMSSNRITERKKEGNE